MGKGRRNYPEEFQRRAVEIWKSVGANEAARQTGVAKTTLNTWAKKFGEHKPLVGEIAVQQAQASARAAQVRSEERAKRLEDRLDRLVDLSGLAIARELQILQAGGANGEGWGKDELQAVTNARVKSIHDIQLLAGKATERTADNSEMIAAVKQAFVLALVDAGLADEQVQRVREAFAYRVRELAVQES